LETAQIEPDLVPDNVLCLNSLLPLVSRLDDLLCAERDQDAEYDDVTSPANSRQP
jgi:hypothetical protein